MPDRQHDAHLSDAAAQRIGARFARNTLAVLAVAESAELAMDALFGTQAILGNAAHFALFLASALGVGVGPLLHPPRPDARRVRQALQPRPALSRRAVGPRRGAP